MKIGLTYDLKVDQDARPGVPDDFQEEFDSPLTVDAVAGALSRLGHEVVRLGNGRQMLARLLDDPPDFVFNFAEGQGVARSREARVPAVLEMLGIPYTGSDPLTLCVTLDKACAKRLVRSRGFPTPVWVQIEPSCDLAQVQGLAQLPYPVIVKPAWEGSSKGIRGKCVVDTPAEVIAAVESLRRDQQQPILVEQYLTGEELTVGMVGNNPPQVLGVMRVLPLQPSERFVYSLEVKRDWERRVRYECPARVSVRGPLTVEEAARAVYEVLGCRDVARIDFRLHNGIPYFLEVNPLPGLNPESSDLVILARLCGWSYPRLIQSIVDAALARHAPTIATNATI
jgi:D-alanine-D-alanine ligase